jgi:hypothetical protein
MSRLYQNLLHSFQLLEEEEEEEEEEEGGVAHQS